MAESTAQEKKNSGPAPREPLLDPCLVRPDWTTGVERNPGLLWLDKNENTDPELLKLTGRLFRELDPRFVATYPEAAGVYRKLADSVTVEPHNLILTPGSDGAIRAVFEAFVNPGDEVIHTLPTFAMYPVYCQMYGAKARPLIYTPSESGPALSVDLVIREIQKTRSKLICLPNPDSPTGHVFTPEEMEAIVKAASDRGSLVLVDEAYHPFYRWSAVPLLNRYKNLVIARTFAKAWGLAGLRVGYAVGDSEIIKYLHKVRPMYEVSTVAVAMVSKILDHPLEIEKSVARLLDGKKYFLSEMRKFGFETLKSEGNFLHVAFGPAREKIWHALSDMVLFRKDFNEPCLKGFSRFSATTGDLFRPVVARIGAAREK